MTAPFGSAGLLLCMGDEVGPELMATGRPWLLTAVDEVYPLPPLGFVLDLGRLLLGEALATSTMRTSDRRLDSALDAYAEHVVGRLRNDRRMLPAADAMAAIDDAHRPGAIAALTLAVVKRIGADLRSFATGPLRRLLRRPDAEVIRAAQGALAEPARTQLLAEQLWALVRAARREGVLLRDGDVFMLENIELLRHAGQRLAFSHIADAAETLERSLPRRVRSRRPRGTRTPTRLEDESCYPTGGYAAIATHGSIEHVISSELVYLEDGDHVDMFDVRYATNELLKFTRDESVFVRERRTIVFELDPDLTATRIKDPGVGWQRLVLVVAVVVAATRRLALWLERADLTVVLRFPDALKNEGDLASMLLREWSENGTVSFEGEDLEGGTVDWVSVAVASRADAPLHISIDGATPELVVQGQVVTHGTGLKAWCGVLSSLLSALI